MSDILVARSQELDGVTRPVSASFAVHVGLVATLALLPSSWFAVATPEKLMVITLGAGVVGPDPNGLTAIGAKKVEQVAPSTARPEPIIPTAPKPTAVTEPIKAPVKPPVKPNNAPPTQAPTTKPVTGAQITPGNAVAATSATGLGVGLATGGQGGTGVTSDFCCNEWLGQMMSRVDLTWNKDVGMTGTVVIQFVIHRDGKITDTQYLTKSGNSQMDLAAMRALSYAQLPPLPEAYKKDILTIQLTFPYIR